MYVKYAFKCYYHLGNLKGAGIELLSERFLQIESRLQVTFK